ncbi:hypothetical protein SAMN02745216_01273 [Desulfatibacillum alkenivorans DSM 16219]|jgi:hypothetical protein|uniref:B box-type domain-containing protein n=1 Tax=Desulfatibacillum alkenivorans DSM 16219 TaxID=1121393 RepID=A0A1M6HNG0_9BACT|nr:B-box zinc finger protein [Desulfatibacillum alkenivorans]SHJ23745.1 hypothetical protein SAMN02745216_01273 [Desulfatibacillum alkenivorans DSM 16219]
MVNCPSCQAQLKPAAFNTGGFEPCPLCEKKFRVEVFPALTAPKEEIQRSEALVDDQAGCFFHPGKKATTVCDSCGRFICALCDLDINGAHMCPQCLETGKEKGSIESLDLKRMRWDKLALLIAVVSYITSFFSGFFALITMFIVIKFWNAPRSITGNTRVRFIIAFLMAISQIALTIFIFYAMFNVFE